MTLGAVVCCKPSDNVARSTLGFSEKGVVQVTRKMAVLVVLLMAQGVLGTTGAASQLTCCETMILVSFRLASPCTPGGLNGRMPTASHVARTFSGVKIYLCVGINSVRNGAVRPSWGWTAGDGVWRSRPVFSKSCPAAYGQRPLPPPSPAVRQGIK